MAYEQEEDVTKRQIALLLQNTQLSINPMLSKMKFNFFIQTPSTAEGNLETLFAMEEWDPAGAIEIASEMQSFADEHSGELHMACEQVLGWPQTSADIALAADANWQGAGPSTADADARGGYTDRAEALEAHEDGGAHNLLRGALARYIQVRDEDINTIINITHNIPGVVISKAKLRTWFKNFLGGFHQHMKDWLHIRLCLTISHTGGMKVWMAQPVEARWEVYLDLFNQFPIAVLVGLFGDQVSRGFDFAGVWTSQAVPESRNEAFQQFFRHMFACLCEDTFVWIFCYMTESATEQQFAIRRRKIQMLSLVQCDPTLKALQSRLGGLGHIPMCGHNIHRLSSVRSKLPGIAHSMPTPMTREPGNSTAQHLKRPRSASTEAGSDASPRKRRTKKQSPPRSGS